MYLHFNIQGYEKEWVELLLKYEYNYNGQTDRNYIERYNYNEFVYKIIRTESKCASGYIVDNFSEFVGSETEYIHKKVKNIKELEEYFIKCNKLGI